MNHPREALPGAILRSLTFEGSRATYSFAGRSEEILEARAMARRMAGAARKLRGMGLDRGQVVPVLCPNSADLWTGFVGAMAADLIPTNLSLPTFKTHLPTYLRNLEALMERYGTEVVLASADIRGRLEGVMNRRVRWIDASELRAESSVGEAREPSSPIAFLQHSSGSTGIPKGVAMTHAAVTGHLAAYAEAIHLDPLRDLIASWLPLYHDMGLVTSFLLPLSHRVSCRSMTPEGFVLDPVGFLTDMAAARATLSWWPNFAFALISDRRHATPEENRSVLDLSAVRALVNCSEVVMASSMDRFLDAFRGNGLRPGSIQASYAMAENVFAVTQTDERGPQRLEVDGSRLDPGQRPVMGARDRGRVRTLSSSGRPIAGVEVAIVDGERREVDDGVVGEIAIAGPFLFSEYLGLPEETAAGRPDGRYFTRDLGLVWQEELYVLGRETDLINVGGRKFLPNEVERIAGSVNGVKAGRVVAFGVRSESKGTENAVVMVESREADDAARSRAVKREIVQAVLQQMDLALADVRVVTEGTLIKTSSGKIARSDNRRVYVESPAGAAQ